MKSYKNEISMKVKTGRKKIVYKRPKFLNTILYFFVDVFAVCFFFCTFLDLREGLQGVLEDKVKSSVLQSGQIFKNRMHFFCRWFWCYFRFFWFLNLFEYFFCTFYKTWEESGSSGFFDDKVKFLKSGHFLKYNKFFCRCLCIF